MLLIQFMFEAAGGKNIELVGRHTETRMYHGIVMEEIEVFNWLSFSFSHPGIKLIVYINLVVFFLHTESYPILELLLPVSQFQL